MKDLREQLACVKRELAMRKSFYTKRVTMGQMKQDKADHELACMEAVVATVQKVHDLAEISEEWKAKAEAAQAQLPLQ